MKSETVSVYTGIHKFVDYGDGGYAVTGTRQKGYDWTAWASSGEESGHADTPADAMSIAKDAYSRLLG